MDKPQRPFNPIISILGDTFQEGKAPIEKVIVDLTTKSMDELEELAGTYLEATYEMFWRALQPSEYPQ
jgi:hypothetical protein